MRYQLSDYEWAAVRPFLPNKPRGVTRVNGRRILNGIFWVLRSGAPWRDQPETFGPYTTCYNRFVRWERAGVWDQIMDALAATHDAAVQMIDTSVVRVHQHGACITVNSEQHMGRSRGGLSTKIHAVVDTNGLPVQLGLTAGETHDNRLCSVFLNELRPRTMLLADRGYDADWIRALAMSKGRGQTSRRNEIVSRQSASAHISIVRETWLNGSSTRSNNVAVSPPDTTGSQPTILPSSSLHLYGFGYVL